MKLFASYSHWMTEGRKLLFSDLGILLLRIWIGLLMALNHGLGKFQNLLSADPQFMPLFGLDVRTSLALAVFTEVFCSIALIIGLFTRLALTQLIATMTVAFFLVHKAALSGEHSGEMAFLYLAIYVALIITGPGRFSIDALITNHFKKAA